MIRRELIIRPTYGGIRGFWESGEVLLWNFDGLGGGEGGN